MKKEKIIFLIGLFFLVLPFSIYGATTLYDAIQVAYDNSKSGTTKTNVQDALDELYSKSKDYCPDGYVCERVIGAEMLINKANDSSITTYIDGNTGEMYTFTHEATEQTETTTDYRYIGSNPNNYITFNNEVWRIIGVFYQNDSWEIKIIRNESIGSMLWDYKKNVGSSTLDYGSNDWTDSQLMYMLNPTSYTLKNGYTEDTTYIYDTNSKIIYQKGCKPSSTNGTSYSCTTNTWSLNETALNQVENTTYYLGGSSSSTGNSATTYYAFERGTTVYSGRPTSWTGKVALMYPSDYAYTFAYGVNDKCYTDTYNCETGTPSASWLYSKVTEWTLSPLSGHSFYAFNVYSSGYVISDRVDLSYGVRPVLYLKSDISLSGTGTESDPYIIVE